jgi:hypothetical protein
MKSKRILITLIEAFIVLAVFYFQIYPDWSVPNATAGDFFCLEIIAMISYNIYDNLKQKI